MMTPQHVAAVRRSFTRICGRHTQVADMFRINLLRIDPSLVVMFHDDPEGHHLMQTFAAVIALLSKPELLLPSLRRLGRRLGATQVSSVQICAVGRAVMDTLQQALGRRWDAETEGAWTAMYAMVSMAVIGALIEVAAESEAHEQRATREARETAFVAEALAA